MRLIKTDENGSMLNDALIKAIEEDLQNNLIPFWVRLLQEYKDNCF